MKITITTPTDNAFGTHVNDIMNLLASALAKFKSRNDRKPVYLENKELNFSIWVEISPGKEDER